MKLGSVRKEQRKVLLAAVAVAVSRDQGLHRSVIGGKSRGESIQGSVRQVGARPLFPRMSVRLSSKAGAAAKA